MKDLIFGITLAPRNIDYVTDCIKSIRKAGFDNRIIIRWEPKSRIKFKDRKVTYIQNKTRKGCFKNYNALMKDLLKTKFNNFIYIQDDIYLVGSCKRRLEKYLTEQVIDTKIKLITRYQDKGYIYKRNLNPYNIGRWSIGATYYMSRDILERVMENDSYKDHLKNYKDNKQIDSIMGKVCLKEGIPVAIANPTLAYHVWAESTLTHYDKWVNEIIDIKCDRIVAGIATIPSRVNQLKKTVASLVPQVDLLYVVLNGWYKVIPDFLLNNPKIFASIDYKRKRWDALKFLYVQSYKRHWYYFWCDDDLIYAENYVRYMVRKLKKFENKVVIGMHWITPHIDTENYYDTKKRDIISFFRTSFYDKYVPILGTGVMAFHTSLLAPHFGEFKYPNMADLWMAKYCKDRKIPMICVRHRAGSVIQQETRGNIYSLWKVNHENSTWVATSLYPRPVFKLPRDRDDYKKDS